VATNVTAKPVTFLHGTNHGCTVVSNLSNSMLHRVKGRTAALNDLHGL